MNRRQFLTGVSAAAVASALPVAPAAPTAITWDLAANADRTGLWIVESTPHGGDHWFRMLYEFNAEHCKEQTSTIEKWLRCYEESEDRLWQPTFPIEFAPAECDDDE